MPVESDATLCQLLLPVFPLSVQVAPLSADIQIPPEPIDCNGHASPLFDATSTNFLLIGLAPPLDQARATSFVPSELDATVCQRLPMFTLRGSHVEPLSADVQISPP